jgi:hypothetical protein
MLLECNAKRKNRLIYWRLKVDQVLNIFTIYNKN